MAPINLFQHALNRHIHESVQRAALNWLAEFCAQVFYESLPETHRRFLYCTAEEMIGAVGEELTREQLHNYTVAVLMYGMHLRQRAPEWERLLATLNARMVQVVVRE